MRVRLFDNYRGKLTNSQLLVPGVHEVSEELANHLLNDLHGIAELVSDDEPLTLDVAEKKEEARETESFVVADTPPDGDEEAIMNTKNTPGLAKGEEPPVDWPSLDKETATGDKFFCCGKNWGNMGALNLHRRSKKCPMNPRHKK